MSMSAQQNCMMEWSYSTGTKYSDPFNEVELDVLFTNPIGETLRAPAFWAGGSTWTVRYASPLIGTHRFRTTCSDAGNLDLHGQEGIVNILPYAGKNPLLLHGPLRVGADRRRPVSRRASVRSCGRQRGWLSLG